MTDSDVSGKVEVPATPTPEPATKTPSPPTPAPTAKPVAPVAAAPAPAVTPEVPKAPEVYEFKSPDGKPVTGPLIDAFTTMAKTHQWTQEAASTQLGALSQAFRDSRAAQQKEWAAAVEADPEIGGDKLSETKALIARARQAFSTPELVKVMDETGLGDHPAIVRAWRAIGKAISPDGFTAGVPVLGRPGDITDPRDLSAVALGKVLYAKQKK